MLKEIDRLDEWRKGVCKKHKQQLNNLATLRNRPLLDALDGTAFLLSIDSYNEWKSFLR